MRGEPPVRVIGSAPRFLTAVRVGFPQDVLSEEGGSAMNKEPLFVERIVRLSKGPG